MIFIFLVATFIISLLEATVKQIQWRSPLVTVCSFVITWLIIGWMPLVLMAYPLSSLFK